MVEEASACAEGDIGRIPVAHLLVYALDRRFTGALFLAGKNSSPSVVRFVQGSPVKVRPGDGYARLGELLIEAGAIDQATLMAALATQGMLGDVLLLAGRLESQVIERIAEQQFLRRMVHLFELPRTTYFRFIEGHEELEDWGGNPATLDPLAILWAGLREHGETSTREEGSLAWLEDAPLKLHSLTTVSRFGLQADENELLDLLRAHPATLAELIGLDLAPLALTRRFVYALVLTRQLDLGHGSIPLGAVDSTRHSSIPPSSPRAKRLGRVQLKATVHRVGAAAPDAPGDGERGHVDTRRTRRSPDSERCLPQDSEAPTSSVTSIPPSSVPQSGDAPMGLAEMGRRLAASGDKA